MQAVYARRDSSIDLLRLSFSLAHPGFCRGKSLFTQFGDVFFAVKANPHNGALSIKAGV